MDKAHEVTIRRLKRAKSNRKSRNARNAMFGVREKFRTKIPNSIKEALLLDKLNRDTKWSNAMNKKIAALEKLGIFKFFLSDHTFSAEFQKPILELFRM